MLSYTVGGQKRIAAPAALVRILLVLAISPSCTGAHGTVVTAGFWFDNVSFELSPMHADRLGGPISEAERNIIESRARTELSAAYAGLCVSFSDTPHALYRVRVVQDGNRPGAAGWSHPFAPFRSHGFVSFGMLAGLAVAHAPADADRATMIEGIGRGIGRAAVHEFAHQILPGVDLHASTDPLSYEYRTADRQAQYYGPMHWSVAWSHLVDKLGAIGHPPARCAHPG